MCCETNNKTIFNIFRYEQDLNTIYLKSSEAMNLLLTKILSLKIKLCFIPKRVTEKMFHNFYISHDLESKKSHFVQKLFFLKVLKFCEHFCSEAIRGIPVIRISSDFNKMGFMSNAVQKNKLLSKIFDNFLSKRFTLGYKI